MPQLCGAQVCGVRVPTREEDYIACDVFRTNAIHIMQRVPFYRRFDQQGTAVVHEAPEGGSSLQGNKSSQFKPCAKRGCRPPGTLNVQWLGRCSVLSPWLSISHSGVPAVCGRKTPSLDPRVRLQSAYSAGQRPAHVSDLAGRLPRSWPRLGVLKRSPWSGALWMETVSQPGGSYGDPHKTP